MPRNVFFAILATLALSVAAAAGDHILQNRKFDAARDTWGDQQAVLVATIVKSSPIFEGDADKLKKYGIARDFYGRNPWGHLVGVLYSCNKDAVAHYIVVSIARSGDTLRNVYWHDGVLADPAANAACAEHAKLKK